MRDPKSSRKKSIQEVQAPRPRKAKLERVSRDITQRKRAKEMLRENEERFRQLAENIYEVFWMSDPEKSRMLYISPAYEQIWGRSCESLYEQPMSFLDAIYPEDRERVVATFEKQARGEPIEVEYRIMRLNGSTRWIRSRGFPVRNELGEVYRIAGIAEDITERKQADEKLLGYQGQLKALASQLTLAEERERRRIATELHDQISQSLVISKMKVDRLRESASDKELNKALDEISNSLGRTIAETRSLTFDLSSPILYELGFEAAVAELLTEQIEEKHGIATEFEDDGLPKPLDDDIRILLFRDVRELLINVVKHAHAHKVKVSIRTVGSQISISVEDDGVGFDPAAVASIGLETNGFGLFSIQERLEQSGGHLEIEFEPGHRARVTITAPLQGEKNAEGRKI